MYVPADEVPSNSLFGDRFGHHTGKPWVGERISRSGKNKVFGMNPKTLSIHTRKVSVSFQSRTFGEHRFFSILNRDTLSSFGSSSCENLSSVLRFHTRSESVSSLSMKFLWLIRSFRCHEFLLFKFHNHTRFFASRQEALAIF